MSVSRHRYGSTIRDPDMDRDSKQSDERVTDMLLIRYVLYVPVAE